MTLRRGPARTPYPSARLVVNFVQGQLGHVLIRLLGVEAATFLTVVENAAKAVLQGPADIAGGPVDREIALQRVDDGQEIVLVAQDQGDDRFPRSEER